MSYQSPDGAALVKDFLKGQRRLPWQPITSSMSVLETTGWTEACPGFVPVANLHNRLDRETTGNNENSLRDGGHWICGVSHKP